LRDALGALALRIDHIGSTSVPGLAAKDVVDLQVIVERLTPVEPLIEAFSAAGYTLRAVGEDHVPAGWEGPRSAWAKLLFLPREGRRVHAHVRVAGSPNERYALLFRDYLRAHDSVRDRWAIVKAELAGATATRDEYAIRKDPLTDELMAGAEAWASATGWNPR
jgi:GrpB-like predicted nucleotidyltransferase (UPF0157 family)